MTSSNTIDSLSLRVACADRSSRRAKLRKQSKMIGVDYVEIDNACDPTLGQRLRVEFLCNQPVSHLTRGNFLIESDDSTFRSVTIERIEKCEPLDPTLAAAVWLWIGASQKLESGEYTLRLVASAPFDNHQPTTKPHSSADPVFDRATFQVFRSLDCTDGLAADCQQPNAAPPPVPQPPGGPASIDYLAREYQPIRDMLLRRLRVLNPNWTERHASDLLITHVELLAYAGDRLSYAQDAVATEAYLSTARRRISVRRLARLIDYRISEGCAARTWVCLTVQLPVTIDLQRQNLTFRTAPSVDAPKGSTNDGSLAFVPVVPTLGETTVTLLPELNRLYFYTWDDAICQLPQGTTSATLCIKDAGQKVVDGAADLLKPGNVLIFVEEKGSRTGAVADADPRKRHAVRLTEVRQLEDCLENVKVWSVVWDESDKLPFALTISCLINENGVCQSCGDISVVLGNVLLVEHGEWKDEPSSLKVPEAPELIADCVELGAPQFVKPVSVPYRPSVSYRPLTHAEPFPPPDLMALRQARAFRQYRDWLQNIFVSRRAALHSDHPQREARKTYFWLKNIVGQLLCAAAGLSNPGKKETWTEHKHKSDVDRHDAALQSLQRNPGPSYRHLLKRADAVLKHLERGRPLSEYDLLEFQKKGIEQFHIVWNSARWYGPASDALVSNAARVVPQIKLYEKLQGSAGVQAAAPNEWVARFDLLSSLPTDRHFVAEIDDSGTAQLRFASPLSDGNQIIDGDTLALVPAPGLSMTAKYRIGQGTIGNVPAEAIVRAVNTTTTNLAPASNVTNSNVLSSVPGEVDEIFVYQPLRAVGGVEPETLAHVRRRAPGTIEGVIERAIIPDDYATLAKGHPGVSNAAAIAVDDGIGTLIVVAIDPQGVNDSSAALLDEVQGMLEGFRRIGHRVMVVPATYVPVSLTMQYRIADGALPDHVRAGLLDVFSSSSSTLMPQGKGFFHPDRWTFGQSLDLSSILTTAKIVPGLQDLLVQKLFRLDPLGRAPRDSDVDEDDVFKIGRLEILQLENNPNRPLRGVLQISQGGCVPQTITPTSSKLTTGTT